MKTQPGAGQGRARSTFLRYDKRRFAIPMGDRLVRGTAHYERDDQLGPVLRIVLDEPALGNPEIIVSESDWRGLILPDTQYGCDFCLVAVGEDEFLRGKRRRRASGSSSIESA
jgi:hypothetical protein